jgi:phosphate transport system substrate-binding protein
LAVAYQESTLDNAVNRAFFAFMQSSNAQNIIIENGFVPVLSDTQAYTIDGALSGTIDISGSTSVQPLMIELAEAFKILQPNITVNVSGGGSGTGYNNAENGVSDFGMISEVFNPERAPSCIFTDIAKDGIAVIVHKDNPLDNITMEQLRKIFDGEAGANAITVWSELITE